MDIAAIQHVICAGEGCICLQQDRHWSCNLSGLCLKNQGEIAVPIFKTIRKTLKYYEMLGKYENFGCLPKFTMTKVKKLLEFHAARFEKIQSFSLAVHVCLTSVGSTLDQRWTRSWIEELIDSPKECWRLRDM